MALMSLSFRYCRLSLTTSAIGPNTVARGEVPVFSSAVVRCCQSPRAFSAGAYQPSAGIMPPDRPSPSARPADCARCGRRCNGRALHQVGAAIPFH
jgi:hypothetical protein